jgi:hypothetical protein
MGRPERVVGPAKGGCAVSCTLVRVHAKRIDKYRKGSGHILWNIIRSFRPPGCAGITICVKMVVVCGPCSTRPPKLLAIDDFEIPRGNVPTTLFLDLAVAVSV